MKGQRMKVKTLWVKKKEDNNSSKLLLKVNVYVIGKWAFFQMLMVMCNLFLKTISQKLSVDCIINIPIYKIKSLIKVKFRQILDFFFLSIFLFVLATVTVRVIPPHFNCQSKSSICLNL